MKPHAVVIPYPAQGHIAPILRLAKLLHYKGFFITFVNTEFNHNRLLRARGPDSVAGLEDFQFKTIPDGLPPPSNSDATQDIPLLSQSISKNCLAPFIDLINNLNNDSSDCPDVSCIVSDGVMSFTLDAADQLGIPEVVFFTTSACGFMGYCNYAELVSRGYVPFKDENCFSNGYLDTEINWIPGMNGIRLRDIPTFIRTTDPDDIMLNYNIVQHANASRARAIILNTFDDLEHDVLNAIRARFHNVHTIGPLQLLEHEIYHQKLTSTIGSNLWKEDTECLHWLDQRADDSVLYINFGSITPLSPPQMVEFAWGLAKSDQQFLWVIRPDLMIGKGSVLPEGFLEETEGRGLLVGWCPQERVLGHRAVGGFLTHCGWNSTIETVSEGVPMVCWPFFAEQQTNCRYACKDWGIGVEIEGDVTRGKVEKMVKLMMEGEKGREMREKALEWKEKARLAAKVGGSSYRNLEKLINGILLSDNNH